MLSLTGLDLNMTADTTMQTKLYKNANVSSDWPLFGINTFFEIDKIIPYDPQIKLNIRTCKLKYYGINLAFK